MSYAQPSDMLARYDARTLGDLVQDAGVTVSPSGLLTDPNLQAALNDGAGEIESSLLRGGMYALSDLTSIMGGSGNAKYVLIRLNCSLAFRNLWKRRPWLDFGETFVKELEQTQKTLHDLQAGVNVLGLDSTIDAGLPMVDTPTLASLDNLNLTVDAARRGYYPARRLPGAVN